VPCQSVPSSLQEQQQQQALPSLSRQPASASSCPCRSATCPCRLQCVSSPPSAGPRGCCGACCHLNWLLQRICIYKAGLCNETYAYDGGCGGGCDADAFPLRPLQWIKESKLKLSAAKNHQPTFLLSALLLDLAAALRLVLAVVSIASVAVVAMAVAVFALFSRRSTCGNTWGLTSYKCED
jgi:hypothetical protein